MMLPNINNNRTLIIIFSNCGKIYLLNHILHQKQESNFRITKSLISILISKLKHHTKPNHSRIMKTALSFWMICYYQNKKTILICFLKEGDTVLLIYISYLKAIFISQKIIFVKLLM